MHQSFPDALLFQVHLEVLYNLQDQVTLVTLLVLMVHVALEIQTAHSDLVPLVHLFFLGSLDHLGVQ